MGIILEFKRPESVAFTNLKGFFEICESVDECNFYLDSVEILADRGDITEKEMYSLRRIGRTKRIELAHPKQEARQAVVGTNLYTPEMGQEKPTGYDMEASLMYYGGHYWIKTALELKGRGIRKSSDSYNDGLNRYTVTKLAYSKLEQQYKIAYQSNLD